MSSADATPANCWEGVDTKGNGSGLEREETLGVILGEIKLEAVDTGLETGADTEDGMEVVGSCGSG